MDHNRPPVSLPVGFDRLVYGSDKLVTGGVAVAVDQELPVVGIGRIHKPLHFIFVGDGRIPFVFAGLSLRGYHIGLGQPGGFSLRRTI